MLPLTLATVMIDPPTALFAGCVLALISIKLIVRDPQREIMKTAIYAGAWSFAYVIAVSFMYVLYPDWMMVYLRDAKDVPLVPVWIVFMIACVACGVMGALSTAVLLSWKKTGLALAVTVGALVFLGLLGWLGGSQYIYVGTFAQFAAGQAPKLMENAHAQTYMNVASGITGAVSVGIIVKRVLETKKLSGAAVRPAA